MELWDGDASIGSSNNQKILVLKQNIETKLNEGITSYHSEPTMRDCLDLNRSQLNELRKNSFIDIEGYRYCILYLPYYMVR